MEMVFCNSISPYYAWLFPEPDGHVNIGLMAGRGKSAASLHHLFDDVLDKHFLSGNRGGRQIGPRRGAPIRCSGRIGRVVDGCVLLAGESAGLVHCATGEGIPFALECGELAAAALAGSIDGAGVDTDRLFSYQRAVRRKFGWPLKKSALLRAFIGSPVFPPAADAGSHPLFQRFAAFVLEKT